MRKCGKTNRPDEGKKLDDANSDFRLAVIGGSQGNVGFLTPTGTSSIALCKGPVDEFHWGPSGLQHVSA